MTDLKKGQLTYRGDIDLTQYYIVSKEFIEIGPGPAHSCGNREIHVRLYLKQVKLR